jgi:hypothetical protein
MPIYRCALEASAGSALMVNVFHIDAITGSAGAIGTGFLAQVSTPYANVLHSAVTLDQIVVTEILQHLQVTTPLNVAGTQSGDMLPPQDAAVLSWKTAYIGRSMRGRTYVFGQAEAIQDGGIINNPQLALLGSLASAIRIAWPATVSGKLVLYHRTLLGYNDITAHVVRDVIYTQRRRTLGVGA